MFILLVYFLFSRGPKLLLAQHEKKKVNEEPLLPFVMVIMNKPLRAATPIYYLPTAMFI